MDAGFFSDGRGWLTGDLIVFAGQAARIKAIRDATNQLVFERPVTWSVGDGVSFPYFGVAPDLGAYECRDVMLPEPAIVGLLLFTALLDRPRRRGWA